MLDFKDRRFITKIVLVVLAIAVAMPGLSAYVLGSKNANVVAEVGSEKIDLSEFTWAYEEEVTYLQNVLQVSLTRQQMDSLGLKKGVLNKLIENKLVDNWVRDLRIDVTEKSVLNAIMSINALRNESGEFDQEKFKSFLRQVGMTEQMFYKAVQKDLLRDMLLKPFFVLNLGYDKVVSDINKYFFQTRVVDIVNFTPDLIPKLPAPKKAQLEKVYNDNKSIFYSKEMRKISYATLTENDLQEQVVVTDDDLRGAVDLAPLEQRVLARYRVFESALEAENARQHLGMDAVLQASDPMLQDWELMPAEMNDYYYKLWPIFESMQLHTISDVIDLGSGQLFVFYLEDRFGSGTVYMKDLENRMKGSIKSKKVKEALAQRVADLENEFFTAKSSFATIAKERGLKVHTTEPLIFDNLSSDLNAVKSQIFDSEEGVINSFVETDSGFVVFVVDKIIPSALMPFDEVVEDVRKIWVDQHSRDTLKMMADSFVKSWSPRKHFPERARVFEEELWRVRAAATENPKQNYPELFVEQVFELKKVGDVTGAIEARDGSVIVGLLKQIKKPKESPIKAVETKSSIRDVVADLINRDIKAHLASKYVVKVNPHSRLEEEASS